MFARRKPPPLAAASVHAADTAVLARARLGDAEAFRVIFEAYAPAVRRFLGDLLRDGPAADEATQEVFVRAHARLASLADAQRLAAWLFGIARNVCFERRRAERTQVTLGDEELLSVEAVLPAPSPERVLLDRELESALDSALGAISRERRAAFVLRVDHGLSYDDIAQVMGWSLQKVKNEIHRARLVLRVQLAGYFAAHAGDEP